MTAPAAGINRGSIMVLCLSLFPLSVHRFMSGVALPATGLWANGAPVVRSAVGATGVAVERDTGEFLACDSNERGGSPLTCAQPASAFGSSCISLVMNEH